VIRVAVADDQELAREGFRLILDAQPDLEVVDTAATGLDAVDLVDRLRPDVVVMDVRMPVMDGVEATRAITAHNPATKVLILTTFDLDEYVYTALLAGASGFLLKEAPRSQLIDAVRTVHRGDVVLASPVTRRLIEEFLTHSKPKRDDSALDRLSPRENEVLGLVARGRSNAEIARELFLSEATVKTHVARILAKLRLRDRVQAVVFAYEHGLIRPGEA
jgi:DNA-binding NarL/FixJ family response regulator